MLYDPTFWVAVAFVIFVALILWKGVQPILAALDDRGERIRREIDEAQTLREEAQRSLADYKRRQRDALGEAKEILKHAKVEAQRLREQAEGEIAASLARREQAAMDKIAQAEAEAVKEVRNQAVDIAIAATARLLSSKVDEAKADALLDRAIQDLPANLN